MDKKTHSITLDEICYILFESKHTVCGEGAVVEEAKDEFETVDVPLSTFVEMLESIQTTRCCLTLAAFLATSLKGFDLCFRLLDLEGEVFDALL